MGFGKPRCCATRCRVAVRSAMGQREARSHAEPGAHGPAGRQQRERSEWTRLGCSGTRSGEKHPGTASPRGETEARRHRATDALKDVHPNGERHDGPGDVTAARSDSRPVSDEVGSVSQQRTAVPLRDRLPIQPDPTEPLRAHLQPRGSRHRSAALRRQHGRRKRRGSVGPALGKFPA